jgi:hypothetical protein
MKRSAICSLVLMSGLASAQSVDWNRVRSSCSSEISAYDAVRGTGDTSYQALRFLETEAGSPPSTSKLRALIDRQRGQLSDAYLMKTPVFKNSAEMYLCTATAALNQLQTGSTQTSHGAPASTPSSQPDSQGSIRGCMRQDNATARFINQCSTRINLSWCAVPHSSSDSTNQHCESQRFSSHELSPGDSVRVDEGALIAWFACPVPNRPGSLKYVSGTGLMGRCVR